MTAVDLTVVIPCYNEEPILAQSVEELVAVLRATRLSYELMFVDDASGDRTLEVIQACRRRYAEIPIQVIEHPRNRGRGCAVSDGCRAARGRLVGYLDIDLEVHARYLPAMVDAIDREGYDGAIAWRIYKVTWSVLLRALCSKGYHALVCWLLRLPFHDTEGGFKFFKREAVLRALEETQDPGWFWDTEIVAHAWSHGLRIKEIPCLFRRRTDKRSTVRVWRDSWRYLVALVRFRRRWLACPAQTGLLYRMPSLYHWAMRLLYRQPERQRLGTVAAHIPAGASVVDVCSGDCALDWHCLRGKGIDYLGVDLNLPLLSRGARRGSRIRVMDVRQEPLPEADLVVMQGSLYQFIPDHHAILQKLFDAARHRVIIAEPIRHWATAPPRWRRALSRRLTNPGTGPVCHRFSSLELKDLFHRYGATQIIETPGGRDLIGVFDLDGDGAA